MKRDAISELHYITPIANVSSILRHGILSHARAVRVKHSSIAKATVQDRRAKVTIPNGRKLHEYANLYVSARNPMLYLRRAQHTQLCVLRVSEGVLDLDDVVISDQNAASTYVRFGPSPGGLKLIDGVAVSAENWTHPDDQIREWRHKSIKCAEVLVPDCVNPSFIDGAYVSSRTGRNELLKCNLPDGFDIQINAHLFFQG